MEKLISNLEIAGLIAREISGELNQQEKESLENWIRRFPQNQLIYQRIISSKNLSERNKLYNLVDVQAGWSKVSDGLFARRPKRSLPQWLKYAAAIVLPLSVGLASWWVLSGKFNQPVQQIATIAPGTRNAVLVMANGENVCLANKANAKIIEKDGTVIKNNEAELNYNGQEKINTAETPLNTLLVPQGGEYSLVLSDGTRVLVNSMSKLVFPVRFTGNQREVTLEGEAYFEVAKDKSRPFKVNIKGIQVEVLGTSFNVRSYPDDNESYTTLVEGKVKLNSGIGTIHTCYLEPNQQAVFNPATSGIVVQNVDASQYMEWTKGRYIFTDQSLEVIMKTLSRWYDCKYEYEDESLKNIRFGGGLNKYERIDPILDIMNKTGKIKVTVKGKEILFSRV